MLEKLENAAFANKKTLPVYSAPGETSYRHDGAQVDTNEKVTVYGATEDGWLLVYYPIGNGTRGRVGYISNETIAHPGTVEKLDFCSIDMQLTRNANGTEDPLLGKSVSLKLKKGDTVTLLAFLDEDWAYVETTRKEMPYRFFIPQNVLMTEDD